MICDPATLVAAGVAGVGVEGSKVVVLRGVAGTVDMVLQLSVLQAEDESFVQASRLFKNRLGGLDEYCLQMYVAKYKSIKTASTLFSLAFQMVCTA